MNGTLQPDSPEAPPGTEPVLAEREHVLVVDDDPALREMLREFLEDRGLRVSAVADGRAMQQLMATEAVDLLVLDLGLPHGDGMQWLVSVRAEARVPVLLLTGRTDEADRVMGLELGADDYVTKPFSPRELLARIRAVLRRTRAQDAVAVQEGRRAYRFAGWELNLRTRWLLDPEGRKLGLTNGEFSLLAAFCATPQRVLSRDQLLTQSRLHAGEVYDRTIDVQILRLRRKLERDPSHPVFIVTERGAGYRFTPSVSSVY